MAILASPGLVDTLAVDESAAANAESSLPDAEVKFAAVVASGVAGERGSLGDSLFELEAFVVFATVIALMDAEADTSLAGAFVELAALVVSTWASSESALPNASVVFAVVIALMEAEADSSLANASILVIAVAAVVALMEGEADRSLTVAFVEFTADVVSRWAWSESSFSVALGEVAADVVDRFMPVLDVAGSLLDRSFSFVMVLSSDRGNHSKKT